MLCPSHGGVYSTDDYFNQMYGKNYNEFYKNIQYECPSIYWCSQKLLSENSGLESNQLLADKIWISSLSFLLKTIQNTFRFELDVSVD